MNDKENEYDSYLGIKTTGTDSTNSNLTNYPYEATPYMVLECIANSGYIRKKNTLLDYGSGKGRVDFFLSYQTKCKCIGIEYDERLYLKSLDNKKTAISSNKVTFENINAVDYIVPIDVDRVYYFNPFNIDVLMETIKQIKKSYDIYNRHILLFFYYPQPKYIDVLNDISYLTLKEEIDTEYLYNNNDSREKVIIYELGQE